MARAAGASRAFWASYPDSSLAANVERVVVSAGVDRRVARAVSGQAISASKPANAAWSSAAAVDLARSLQGNLVRLTGAHPSFATLPAGQRDAALRNIDREFRSFADGRDGLRPVSANLVGKWGAAILAVVVMLAVLGWRLKRTLVGVLVGSRNKLSLSRLQMYLWTTLITSLFLITSTFLIGVAPLATILPTYPWELWALLGIAIATVPASGLILKPKQDQQPTLDALERSSVEDHVGLLEQRHSPDSWSFLDFFTGEEVANANEVEVSRFQSFFITVVLAIIFVGWCSQIFWSLGSSDDWSKWAAENSYPKLGTTFIGLVAVSHGAYLAFKGITKTETNGARRDPLAERAYREGRERL
jgi:hypothetical protein